MPARPTWRVIASAILITVLAVCHAQAQILPSYSALTGDGNLLSLPGLNPTQQMMAQSINSVCPTINTIASTPAQNNLAGICANMVGNALAVVGQPTNGLPSYGLSAAGLKDALSEINGGAELVVPTSQTSTISSQQTNAQTGVIENRLSLLRQRIQDGTAFAANDAPAANQVAAAGGSDLVPGINIAQAPPGDVAAWSGRLGVYLAGTGQFGDRDGSGNQNGYSFNNAGFIVGADYIFTPQFVAGVAFGYSHAETDFDASASSASGQSLDADLLQGNVYATYSITPQLYLNAMGLVGGSTNDSTRQIAIASTTSSPSISDTATGSFGSRTYGASLGVGYAIPLGGFVVTPTARFDYRYISTDGFSENGASGLDLRYGGSSNRFYQSFIGGRVQYPIPTGWGQLIPEARAQWAHQYNGGAAAVSVAYANDPTVLSAFVMPGDPSDRDFGVLGVGATLQLAPNRAVYLNYDAVVGLSRTTYNSLVGGIRFNF